MFVRKRQTRIVVERKEFTLQWNRGQECCQKCGGYRPPTEVERTVRELGLDAAQFLAISADGSARPHAGPGPAFCLCGPIHHAPD